METCEDLWPMLLWQQQGVIQVTNTGSLLKLVGEYTVLLIFFVTAFNMLTWLVLGWVIGFRAVE